LGSAEFVLHTDGSYLPSVPAFALQCISQSEGGGESLLLDGSTIYRHLLEHEPTALRFLFDDDALRMNHLGRKSERSMFFHVGERIGLRFRVQDGDFSIDIKAEASAAYNASVDFVKNKARVLRQKLQESGILLVDNLRMLHGRTSFTNGPGRVRFFRRLWFCGDGGVCDVASFGFDPAV
jgi:gamma-butyrobetaine dioxygenase